jgi:beta-lactam-binding protein with PASTA domain
MRRFFGYLVRLLVLVVVFMVSALTAMRFAIHGRQTTVPKITGMTTTEARRALSANGLVLDTTDRFYSSEVQEGRILSQVPAPGGEVRRGWRVRVAESLGPLRVVIPDLIGGSERAADINIRRRGLELGNTAIATVPYAPADQIVGQSPSANAANVSAPKVSVLLAAPEDRPSFVMPDLTGRNENDVVNLIVAAGMRVGNISSQAAPADGVSQSN